MELSFQIPARPDTWKVAQRAEQLGYSSMWFNDSPLLDAELFAAMAVAAVKTSTIKLCTGVAIPSFRIPPVVASGLATLNALAPGRIGFGVSTGYTGRRTMGMKAVPAARMSRYIADVRGLLSGDLVEWETEGACRKIQLIDPELGQVNIGDPIPVAISAFGPKAQAAVVEHGAQWIGASSFPEREQEELTKMLAQWEEAGRDPEEFFPIVSLGGRVLDDDESADSEKCRAQAGPYASLLFHGQVEAAAFGELIPGFFPFPDELEQYRKVYEQYEPADARYLSNHRGHLTYVRPDETHLTGDIIKAFTTTGTKTEMVERLSGMKAAGFKQAMVHIVPDQADEMLERWADVMAEVNS